MASLADEQRFFLLLAPQRIGSKHRLIIIGKKRLPHAEAHERYFGFVDAVGDTLADVLPNTDESTGALRLVGEGEEGEKGSG